MKSVLILVLLSLYPGCDGSHVFLQVKDIGRDIGQDINTGSAALNATLSSLVGGLLLGRNVNDVEKEMMSRMDAKEAARRLSGKIPPEVASLVKMSQSADPTLTNADIERAINILNGLVVDAWVRLDAKVKECKEFQARNRDTYEQVMIDLARLGSQIAESEGDRSRALSDTSEAKSGVKLTKEHKEQTLAQYTLVYNQNFVEFQKQDSERAVWNFIMQITNCKTFGDTYAANTGFVQMEGSKVCQNDKNEYSIVFDNPEVQQKLESVMTPEARKTLNLVLSKHAATSFRQMPTNATAVTISNGRVPTLPTVPLNREPAAGTGQWKKCSEGEVDCGLLHDTISLLWGGFRDKVDEKKAEMAKNLDEWNIQKAHYNDEIRIYRDAIKKANKELADAVKRINVDTEEKNKKNGEKLELEIVYTKRMTICKAEIGEIMFTFICGIRVTRNVLIVRYTPPMVITDCDVTDWNPGPCSAECDDECPVKNDPYKCGGTHTLTREIIQEPGEWGIPCPSLSSMRTCNQKKCPVDCVQSQWSGWSSCSKECGGGLQGRTRDILVPPSNGGTSCEGDAEERACHTHSCDRDCLLSTWTRWSGCSQACDGGTRFRKKLVTRVIRGNGECPTEDSADRLEREPCNSQQCYGDEICIAKQDLIVAIDASGSVKSFGFNAIQKFAANLTARYQEKYYGQPAMKVGVIGFGNGEVNTAGLVAPASNVHALTFELDKMRESISKMEWLRGFTNMGQALIKADEMFLQGSRREAHSGVLLITDGKPSLIWQTEQKVKQLKAKNIMLYAAVISASETDSTMQLMKQWVSSPWDSNLVRIPSHKALDADPEVFVSQVIAKFCPFAMSPTQNQQNDQNRKYMLIFEGGYPSDSCGTWKWVGFVQDMDACARAARGHKFKAFAWGKDLREGGCYSEAIPVTQEIWDEWVKTRKDPPCPKGAWIENLYYDTYVINPVSWEENA